MYHNCCDAIDGSTGRGIKAGETPEKAAPELLLSNPFKMRFSFVLCAVLAILAVAILPNNGASAAQCRRTKCHTHSSQNECNGDEYVAKWGYCWGVAGKWESCCKK
ncbi:unnamed protein product [Caenorhabditis auriculariae]|uniref:Uncharacterized protein n=1 Tax=Caenorhabditis auriculariae TaxID=2777116 RepID=A0A8S1GTY2_9PELO|nr:unnamed protein product [Caenorhabditis auriculariae]